jgi:HlyD family secretion protein
MIKRIIIGLVLVGAVVAITMQGLKPRPPKATDVSVAKAQKGTITRTITAAGKLNSTTTVRINSNISGDLVELDVAVGDRVKKGQVLGRIDPTRYRAQVKSSTAALAAANGDVAVERVAIAKATDDLKRLQGLFDKGLSPAAELEQGQHALDAETARLTSSLQRVTQSQAALDESLDFLNKTTIVSPIEGEVIELDRQRGERVRGSDLGEDVIMVLAALAKMEVKVEVGEHEVVYLHQDDKATVELDAFDGKSFTGQVIEIGQNAIIKRAGTESEVTTFQIRVGLDARPPGALPGMSSTVRIATETHKDTLVVPIQCVTVRAAKLIAQAAPPPENKLAAAPADGQAAPAKKEQSKAVFVMADGVAKLREVTTGLSSDTQVEILSGLKEGDTIIEGPYRTLAKELKDGDRVSELKEGETPKEKG